MNNFTVIYALIDPRTETVFYVGRTTTLLSQRFANHLRDGRKGRTLKGERIAEILALGLKPGILEIAKLGIVSAEEAHAAEQAWIDFYALTQNLANTSSSARGGHGQNAKARKVDLPDDLINQLGKVSDTALSNQFCCNRKIISNERRRRGISQCPQARPRKILIPDDILLLLGKIPDCEIALKIGCSASAINRFRNKIGIPQCPQTSMPAMGRKPVDVPESIINRLGTVPDYQLAEEAGVSQWTIWTRRVELGILSFSESQGHSTRFEKGHRKVELPDEVLSLLGQKTDCELGRIFNVSHQVVRARRIELGIPRFKP